MLTGLFCSLYRYLVHVYHKYVVYRKYIVYHKYVVYHKCVIYRKYIVYRLHCHMVHCKGYNN